MLLLLLSFYSHLHLLLSLAPLFTDWMPWQLVGHVPLIWSKVLSIKGSSRGYWKESQSWFCIGNRNKSKLFISWRCKSYNMDENSLEKLDNELHVKERCLTKKSMFFIFPTNHRVSAINR